MDTPTPKKDFPFFLSKKLFLQKKQKTGGHGGHAGHNHIKERLSMNYKKVSLNSVSKPVRVCPAVSTCPRVHDQNQVF